MAIVNHALTTKKRVKNRMGLDKSNIDTEIERMINRATDIVENYTERRFKKDSYDNEIYSIETRDINELILRHAPLQSISSVEERDSDLGSPTWRTVDSSKYDIKEDGEQGIIVFEYFLPTGGNAIRASYDAGYKIDFGNSTDTSKHTLPFEISDVTERIAIRMIRRRENDGTKRQSYQDSETTYKSFLDKDMKNILDKYYRPVIK